MPSYFQAQQTTDSGDAVANWHETMYDFRTIKVRLLNKSAMPNLQQQIEAAIHEFWEEVTLADAAAPAGAPEFPEAMDSLTAVDVLLKLEPIVGIKLEPYQVIRRGGYDSKEQLLQELTEKILQHVEKAKGGAKT